MFWSPDIELAVQDVNDYLRSLAAENVIILDAASILTQDERVNSNDYVDELHLNQAGYEVLNQELADILRKGN